jgi:hypothetical protein
MARMRFTLVAATATIAAFAAPATALAATTDCEGLQDALDNAANTVVTLDEGAVCSGHFDLPSRTITFEGAGTGATLDGQGESQILSGFNVGTTTIRNLSFIHGAEFDDDGGAIQIFGDSSPTIEGNEFLTNSAEDDGEGGGNGGAVALELDNQLNVAARGSGGPVVLRGNTFGGPDDGNYAENDGGAVYIDARFRTITVEDNTFSDNEGDDDRGGGLSIDSSQSVTLDGNTFTRNEAGDDGGGASVETCRADVTGNVFASNKVVAEDSSLDGGGLYLSGNLCQDSLDARGDAVPTLQSDNRFRLNAINGEFSTGRGGGEYIEDLEVLSTDDRFVGNRIEGTDSGFGGGLGYGGFSDTPLVARNLVATGNLVAPADEDVPERGFVFGNSHGGGLFLSGNGRGSEFEIDDSTIEGNTAAAGSGIGGTQPNSGAALTRGAEGVPTDVLVVSNSIVHDNNTTGTDDGENAIDGEIDGFIARDVRSSDVCVDGAPHSDGEPNSNVCADPKLKGPIGDENVDQTGDSPTIDAGDNSLVHGDLTKDYAGDGRVLDGNGDGTSRVDMGADEYKPPTVEPEPTPTPAVQPPAPAPQGAVLGQTQKSCVSRRVFSIRIRVPKGKKARSATVRVNNKKVKVVRGTRLRAPVRLRGLPKGRFTVKITVRLANGKKVTGKRIYHTCVPKLPGFAASAGPADALPDEPDLVIRLPAVPTGAQVAPVFVDAFEEPGRLLYRFDAVIANQGGTLDLFRDPGSGGVRQAVWPGGQPTTAPRPDEIPSGAAIADRSGSGAGFVYAYEKTHQHWHFSSAARYELQPAGGAARAAEKVGFCLFDSFGPANHFAYAVRGAGGETWCGFGAPDQPSVRMGLSPGGADIYSAQRERQWVDITGLEPGPAVMRAQANPLHCILESDEANNSTSDARQIPGVRVAGTVGSTGAGTPVALALSGTVIAPDVPARRSGGCTPGSSRSCYVWASADGPLTFRVVGEPSHGTVALAPGRGLGADATYTPAAGFAGEDAFTYVATDARGLTSSPETVRAPPAVTARARLTAVRVERRHGRWRVVLRSSAPARLSGRLERRLRGRRVTYRLRSRRVTTGPARMALGRLAPGRYRLRLDVDGKRAATAAFRVGRRR